MKLNLEPESYKNESTIKQYGSVKASTAKVIEQAKTQPHFIYS